MSHIQLVNVYSTCKEASIITILVTDYSPLYPATLICRPAGLLAGNLSMRRERLCLPHGRSIGWQLVHTSRETVFAALPVYWLATCPCVERDCVCRTAGLLADNLSMRRERLCLQIIIIRLFRTLRLRIYTWCEMFDTLICWWEYVLEMYIL